MQDERPTANLALRLADLGAQLDRRLATILTPYELTPAEFRILAVLVERGATNASEIATLTPIDPSFVSRMVQRLSEKRLLTRRRSRSDRRTVSLRPTDSGRELLAQLEQPMQNLEREVLHGLAEEERDQVAQSAEAMLGNLGVSDAS